MVTLTTEQFKQMRQREPGFPTVNVLPSEMYEKSHIPGTINIPLGQPDFVEQVREHVIDADAPLVVYCASESCDASSKAAKKLEDAGFTQVYDYEGGTASWKEAGEPVDGESEKEEVFGA